MLFNVDLEYAIRRVQVNHNGLKLNYKRKLLVYANVVNIFRGSVNTIQKKGRASVVDTKKTGQK